MTRTLDEVGFKKKKDSHFLLLDKVIFDKHVNVLEKLCKYYISDVCTKLNGSLSKTLKVLKLKVETFAISPTL